MSDLIYTSAVDLARRIRKGELSPVEVVDAHLERIDARNDEINAFVTVTAERARDAAEEAERAVEEGEEVGPLHGVPVAIKDLNDVDGVRTTFGSRLFADNVASSSDPFVDRLLAAGAIVIGKTNTPEFGLGCTTDNLVIGPTSTPFGPGLNAGGSSGGSAAALAAGMVPLAQGSDTGGSLRTPASFCGVYGFKPSFGRVPNVSRPNAFGAQTPFSHIGPMARTVEDAALMLDVMAGPHPDDPFSLPTDSTRYLDTPDRSITDFAIAYSPNLGVYPVESEVEKIVEEAAYAFEATGASVERMNPDLGADQAEILDAFYTFAKINWEGLFDSLERGGLDPYGGDRERLRPVTVETIFESDEVTTREYNRAQTVRTRVYDGIQDILSNYEILVTPTLGVPPFQHGEHPTSVAGIEIEPLRGWVLTQPFNFSGHPVGSVPAGLTSAGLPVGMQIVGRRNADADVLAASAAFSNVDSWGNIYSGR